MDIDLVSRSLNKQATARRSALARFPFSRSLNIHFKKEMNRVDRAEPAEGSAYAPAIFLKQQARKFTLRKKVLAARSLSTKRAFTARPAPIFNLK